MSAEVERQLLNHYKLDSLYPAEWPQRDDDSDGDNDDEPLAAAAAANGSSPGAGTASSSRFAGLDRRASMRSTISGTQKTAGGAESLVQKDEPDPLGIAPSVVQQLRRRGLPVEDNLKLRNRFMLSSTTFSPTLFLSQVHQDASTESLLQGLDFLSRSIEKKSASLKVLVESNFERFVKAKATIDNVYQEMRNQGQDPNPPSPASHMRTHSRHTSRGNANFRSISGTINPARPPVSDKRKNALTKESEYGVLGIKAPLIELAGKAEEVWGPALGGRDKEEQLKAVLTYVEQHRSVFCIAGNLQEAIKKRDYDTLVDEYSRARRLADQASQLADQAASQDTTLSDAHVNQILVAAKVWHDTQKQLQTFKRDAWKQLSNTHTYRDAQRSEEQRDSHMTLIGTLLQLSVDENPIWYYLSCRYDQLKDLLTASFERTRLELEVARRKLANDGEVSIHVAKIHLQSASAHLVQDRRNNMDTPKVLDFWDKVHTALTSLLAVQGGILGDIIDFWETAQAFIDGKAQRDLPNGVFSSATARQHLKLADDEIRRLRIYATDLITTVCENTYSFFADPPIDDISSLVSPTPATPSSASGLSPVLQRRKFSFESASIPPQSPARGEAWEKYAFWAPYANSLSGAHYLSRLLTLVGIAACEAGNLTLVKESPRLLEQLKPLVVGVRERCVQAVCAAWNTDSDTCKLIEDFTRNSERRDLTNMPMHFSSFQETLLQNMQKIMYISEAVTRTENDNVIVPPSGKLLQVVRHQFVNSMYKALSGTVENAERNKGAGNTGDQDPDGVTIPAAAGLKIDVSTVPADATDRSTRILLTLSNLSYLRKTTIPNLLSQFENHFSISLTNEQQTLRDVLSQIDARLFQSYTSPTVTHLSHIITAGIISPTWEPTSRPTNANPYVYDTLLALVLVHAQVSSTSPLLTNQILSYHLEQISSTFLASFRAKPSYSLPALMQATLDVELVAQTLSNYTTDKASDLQSQIYLVLDERTDTEARTRLQGELPGMRTVLKRLREGTKGEFGCFKRERRGRTERPGSRGVSGQSTAGGPGP